MEEPKKLYRSTTDRIFLGVCGGLGEYFKIDALLIRVVFIILAIMHGIGVVAYLILAVIIPLKPEGVTSSVEMPDQKLDEFAQALKDKADSIGEEVKKETALRDRRVGKTMFALFLIIVGLLIIADEFFPVYWLQWRLLLPVLVVFFGFYILIKK